MEETNPYIKGTYEWHNFEIKTSKEGDYALVWEHIPFFWDKSINRPKSLPKAQAHLCAVMFILTTGKEFVYVEDAQSYFQKKYFSDRA